MIAYKKQGFRCFLIVFCLSFMRPGYRTSATDWVLCLSGFTS